ncbi:Potassium channel [Mortierella alpina]|uniref:Potassium channel n=1 Tax=Mortierella alpina TaxID=64518 RepID=A0A9P6LZB7_MORAP|nr:Potassium channel [Mortierella alpina]
MWNPPPPDIRVSVKRRPDVNKPKPQGAGLSPRVSLSNDPGFPLERSNNPSIADDSLHRHDSVMNNNNLESSNNDNHPASSLPFNPFSSMHRATAASGLPHPRLEKVGPYLAIASLQAYTVLTVVRCLADPVWIDVRRSAETPEGGSPIQAEIGHLEKSFLACAIAFTMLSCVGVTLRILDKLSWLKRIPVITAYLEAALTSFLSTHSLPPGGQFSHGFLSCIITAVFSSIVALMLTVDWWRGFPSAGLSATLKALIISSFVMTIVIIIGAAIYSALEGWRFDDAVNFCIVSFATIGYGNLSPRTVAGRIIFFFYGLLGISSLGFFVVSLRNAVIEQFQWRLVDRFSAPAHLTRVQTRMSAKDISFPAARFEEEQQVKIMVKRKMILRMVAIWIFMWFGGAGVFCAFEPWTYLESLYFCFVTLTTIGFGDYVPNEPGSIEFWNVYVFVGLSVFAYILSLSSESMASQIHLVDDQEEEDDADMYGWERNEDPNAPMTTRSAILGLEGLKWLHHQQQQQQQGSNVDLAPLDEEGKPVDNQQNGSTPSFDGEGSLNGDQSLQSSLQRYRSRQRSSTGRILTVSAKERKQMLQAEYYASHSLPATIRFVDTKGVPHQKTIGRGLSTSDAYSGPSGEAPRGDQQPEVYGTVGYFGSLGGRDTAGLKRVGSNLKDSPALRGVGVAHHGTMYGAGSLPLSSVQTQQLQHQPLIRFDSPKGSINTTGGHHHAQSPRGTRDTRATDQDGIKSGYIPSCMDLFRQSKQQADLGEGPSTRSRAPVQVQELPVTRVRSNSWDQSQSQYRAGPSENEVHRWLAEGAGTLKAPAFRYNRRMPDELEVGVSSSSHGPGPSQSSDTTQFTSPPVSSLVSPAGSAHSEERQKVSSFKGQSPIQQREGVAPNDLEIVLTEEPQEMSANDPETLQGAQEIAVVNNNEPIESASSLQGLFSPNMSPLSQLSEHHDHERSFRPSMSRPMSLFSNHPRSGHNSAVQSPASSRPSSRPPSVLMTIFDEPVTNLPGSRPASRAPSLAEIARVDSRDSSTTRWQPAPHMAGLGISGDGTGGTGLGRGEGARSSTSTGPVLSPSLSETSVGPFDEVRSPETIHHFDDDVDLNKAELHPQQVEDMQRYRADLRRREHEIEAQQAHSRGRKRS